MTDASDPQSPRKQYVRVQRTPAVRFTRWLVLGGLLGAVAGVAVALLGESEPRYTENTQTAYLAMMGLLLGVMVAGLLAGLVDVALTRRSRDQRR